MIPYLKYYCVWRIISDSDIKTAMSRPDFDMYQSMSGVAGKSHTDEEYAMHINFVAAENAEIASNFGKEILSVRKIAVGENTDLSLPEKENGFVKWLT